VTGGGNRYPMKDAPGPLGKIGVFTPLVGVVVAFVVLSTLSTGGGLWPSTDSASERTTTTTAPPATSTRATTTGRPTPTTRSAAVTAALLPGYQGIAVESRGVAYDVPEGWVVDSPSTIRGFENEQGRISGTGTAAEGEDYCGENNRATSFVSRSDVPDLAAAATEWGDSTARIAFDSSGWTRRVTGPENLTTRSGLTGAMVETTGPQTPDPADCATAYSIYTFAFTGSEGTTLLLTIAADREVTGEVTPDQAREIFSTVRLLN
ncbi:hypothetical protein, partial [Nocardia farcinica]|uniref:hypothetical protein n=1 Tax=Nocardia farcinica TaxID=37329 RepID=UPI0024576D47